MLRLTHDLETEWPQQQKTQTHCVSHVLATAFFSQGPSACRSRGQGVCMESCASERGFASAVNMIRAGGQRAASSGKGESGKRAEGWVG